MKTAHTATATTTATEFANGSIDKWTAYGRVFDLVDRRRITLTEVAKVFATAGIPEEVTRMRRRQFLGMRAR